MKNCHASAFPAPRMSDCKISTSDTIGKNYAKMYRLRAELKKLVFDVDGKKVLFCNFVSAGADVASTRIFINPRILYNGSNYKNVEILGKFCEL